ncbi:hypothetical protein JAAARDRAFT_494533 [Jaapia argillacea MUCL 33604]|uniref:Uncharacterized protein n=1 Tax=Jaapia argillacea MUCL 33604 TaxID=933084 RepID=A0A067PDC5_9AGAM|nr:hypothetical protein JAAARDRAFT_494533 [Jaapia argillacea MUCL 33604]
MISRGFEAYITIGGRRLDEYNVTESGKKGRYTCSTTVPSEAGEFFAVVWEDLREEHGSSYGEISFDGVFWGGCEIFKDSPVAQLLTFSKLEAVTDEDESPPPPQGLGTIKLQILELTEPRSKPDNFDKNQAFPPLREGKALDYVKETQGHCIQLSGHIKQPPTDFIKAPEVEETPIVTFIFEYKPLHMLIASGIAAPLETNQQIVGSRRRQNSSIERSNRRTRRSSPISPVDDTGRRPLRASARLRSRTSTRSRRGMSNIQPSVLEEEDEQVSPQVGEEPEPTPMEGVEGSPSWHRDRSSSSTLYLTVRTEDMRSVSPGRWTRGSSLRPRSRSSTGTLEYISVHSEDMVDMEEYNRMSEAQKLQWNADYRARHATRK